MVGEVPDRSGFSFSSNSMACFIFCERALRFSLPEISLKRTAPPTHSRTDIAESFRLEQKAAHANVVTGYLLAEQTLLLLGLLCPEIVARASHGSQESIDLRRG